MIGFCDQEHLDHIGSTKKCKSKAATYKWLQKLDMSGHYNKPFVNVDNLEHIEGPFNTLEGVVRY